jgi:hypothetical protein
MTVGTKPVKVLNVVDRRQVVSKSCPSLNRLTVRCDPNFRDLLMNILGLVLTSNHGFSLIFLALPSAPLATLDIGNTTFEVCLLTSIRRTCDSQSSIILGKQLLAGV